MPHGLIAIDHIDHGQISWLSPQVIVFPTGTGIDRNDFCSMDLTLLSTRNRREELSRILFTLSIPTIMVGGTPGIPFNPYYRMMPSMMA
ncbi:hypothetical protein [Salinicola sp. CPA57]|uniref:hypothetical protein n=1 Tax=Salinicola sp. CPA57 TaxID=1949080 RepID=UPI00130057E2|nr:hypothetical protein [Salinicola sp. CPA57]